MSKKQKIYLPFKRIISIFGSIIGITVCATLLWWWVLPINLIVTKGHPTFTGFRIGKNGKEFGLLKFRSMKRSVDPNLTNVEAQALKEDPFTGFGKFLRKTSIDETLQLFNILVGQMAFIGPRPLIDKGDDHTTIAIRKENGSISLTPGISGYAQTNGRTKIPADKRAELDYYYYKHISLWLDIKIFFKSFSKAQN